ncbi:hypothetical protein [Bacillus sp. JCM 19041]|uniref:hypothetical protein n=1 Tax=Bacillus sp. JCM 19041 TaxID=1460637 RepID=UPI0012E11B0B
MFLRKRFSYHLLLYLFASYKKLYRFSYWHCDRHSIKCCLLILDRSHVHRFFPGHYAEVTIITTVAGMLIGMLFGSLVSRETMVTGYANGLMSGFMAPMVGMMIMDHIVLMVGLPLVLTVIFILFILSNHLKQEL